MTGNQCKEYVDAGIEPSSIPASTSAFVLIYIDFWSERNVNVILWCVNQPLVLRRICKPYLLYLAYIQPFDTIMFPPWRIMRGFIKTDKLHVNFHKGLPLNAIYVLLVVKYNYSIWPVDVKQKAEEAYKNASEVSQASLPATHPIRLGLALNFSVFYYEIRNNPQKACQFAKKVKLFLSCCIFAIW